MTFTAYIDRQRQAVRTANFVEDAPVCGRKILAAYDTEGEEERCAARYYERLSAKLFEELNSLQGFRREEEEACC